MNRNRGQARHDVRKDEVAKRAATFARTKW